MRIKKRSMPMYIFLNCLTLGIYGFIVSNQIGAEVHALCKGDGEEPAFGYFGAVLFRAIAPIIGIIIGLILALAQNRVFGSWLSFFGGTGVGAITVFLYMTVCGLIMAAIATAISGIYLKYWWYRQANRLQLNAHRYGLTVKESGTDHYLMRTACNMLFLPATAVLFVLALLIPALIIYLFLRGGSVGAVTFAVVLLFLVSLPIMFFGHELTVGAHFSAYFMFKTLNRYSDVYRNGATQFDPMGYPYYPSVNNKYPSFVPVWVDGNLALKGDEPDDIETPPTNPLTGFAKLYCEKGSCAGYEFDISDGEEFIIGKDARVSQIVIDPAYQKVSRKHVGVSFDSRYDEFYVTDYSSNGTWADNQKMTPGQRTRLQRGTVLKLADGKNVFRLA